VGPEDFGFLGDECAADLLRGMQPVPALEQLVPNIDALVEVGVAHQDDGLIQCAELRVPLSFQPSELIIASEDLAL
jgi:hypothetical protein